MRNRKDRETRPSCVGVEKLLNVERLAFHPACETRRRDQVIDLHSELEPIVSREERIEIHHTDLRDWRRLNFLNQGRNIEIAPVGPLLLKNIREENVFTTAHRIGVNADEAEQAGDSRIYAFGQ